MHNYNKNMRFLSNVLAVIVGLLIFWVIAFFILAGIIAVSSGEGKVATTENSILHLNLENVTIVERTSDDDLDFSAFGGFGAAPTLGANQLKKAIRTAKNDDNIKGIYLQSGSIMSGQSLLKEIREELSDFKESGKFIIAYSEYFSETGYYLTTVADQVYLNPMGGLEFNGLASEMVFLKGLFEKLEVEPVVFRVGEFKDFVEPYTRNDMSAESRESNRLWLDELWLGYTQQVESLRGLPDGALEMFINDWPAHVARSGGDAAASRGRGGRNDRRGAPRTEPALQAEPDAQRHGERRAHPGGQQRHLRGELGSRSGERHLRLGSGARTGRQALPGAAR